MTVTESVAESAFNSKPVTGLLLVKFKVFTIDGIERFCDRVSNGICF